MRNQNVETDFAWSSTECNALCQFKVIIDLIYCLHYQHGVLFVVHKGATVRAHKISWSLSHIYLMYNPIWTAVSKEGIKITITRKHLSISFGVRRKQYITDKIAFNYFINLILMQINCFQTRAVVVCLPFYDPLLRNRKTSKRISLLNRGYALNWLAGVCKDQVFWVVKNDRQGRMLFENLPL